MPFNSDADSSASCCVQGPEADEHKGCQEAGHYVVSLVTQWRWEIERGGQIYGNPLFIANIFQNGILLCNYLT